MGASVKVEEIVKSLKHRSWYERDIALDKVAGEYGDGFAKVVRGECVKKYGPSK